MGIYYFIVNHTKKEFLDAMNKLSGMAGDGDLWDEFINRWMNYGWKDDDIDMLPDFDEWGLDYTPIKIEREEEGRS